ncbi:endonuclease/exonuclease/phosphatase (EEP) superfamily protein YafD [Agromyces terreus]|uniref:Endonuclease/exonuclease/phosphatase (EEP) superfamily protein YafD n=1 Tax=Agromyces terreus TaxID=424795 RepID=A0A9X2H9B4_9MICO|nr:endonuclease/exonuclease/phosphatase family protein [Agromyces terreus]MCP2372379.1 endonuclease/exonuclease/phosphatase (EEP) superfamily protein YafD [Agromyces terreus]
MLPRILGWILVSGSALLAALLLWPQALGLQNQWVFAHVVALRGVAGLGALVAAVLLLLLAFARPLRTVAFGLAAVCALFAAGNAAVLTARGFASTEAAGDAASDAVTVLSWNTLGEVPDASTVADLALSESADVVVLPETTGPLGEDVAVAMREGGSPMWVHTAAFDDVAKARSTTILISPDLGDYEVTSALVPGPPGNTNTLPSVVADPVSGEGPRIVAVHAVAPIRWELRNWRSDLDWLAEQCAGGNVIMAGDFNATVDHFAGRGTNGGDLGDCADAAVQAGSAGLGTWPTDLPQLLASPIDHVLATPGWQVDAFRVVGELDAAGSDHRPIVATLSPSA